MGIRRDERSLGRSSKAAGRPLAAQLPGGVGGQRSASGSAGITSSSFAAALGSVRALVASAPASRAAVVRVEPRRRLSWFRQFRLPVLAARQRSELHGEPDQRLIWMESSTAETVINGIKFQPCLCVAARAFPCAGGEAGRA